MSDSRLLMISAMYENGGNVTHRFLDGHPIGRIVGPDAMQFEGWQRLHGEYAKQFGLADPGRQTDFPKL